LDAQLRVGGANPFQHADVETHLRFGRVDFPGLEEGVTGFRP
jgi:hypothetical protein